MGQFYYMGDTTGAFSVYLASCHLVLLAVVNTVVNFIFFNVHISLTGQWHVQQILGVGQRR